LKVSFMMLVAQSAATPMSSPVLQLSIVVVGHAVHFLVPAASQYPVPTKQALPPTIHSHWPLTQFSPDDVGLEQSLKHAPQCCFSVRMSTHLKVSELE